MPKAGMWALVILAGILALGLGSCKKSGSPRWDAASGETTVAIGEIPGKEPTEANERREAPPATTPRKGELRFVSYNVKNWLGMERYVDRKPVKEAPKPQNEKEAVIAILVRQMPDVIGLCEIGSAGDLAEVQQLLKDEGVVLPYLHYIGGSDPVRHLGFLSRYPIVATGKPEKMDYQIQGKTFGWNRGVLDVTIQANGKPYHFLGVHFKSKREVEEGDEEEMRRSEARLLRRHIDGIFARNPDERLIVYGDFNDTRASVAAKHVFGSYNDPGYLTAVAARDAVGTSWTHYWALHDIYSRIDFIAVSKALKPDTHFKAARVLDEPEWETASDHRAVLAIFK